MTVAQFMEELKNIKMDVNGPEGYFRSGMLADGLTYEVQAGVVDKDGVKTDMIAHFSPDGFKFELVGDGYEQLVREHKSAHALIADMVGVFR